MDYPTKFTLLIESLKLDFDLKIVFINRHINEMLVSAYHHFIRIVNNKNISHLANQFNFRVNNFNYSFNPSEVRIGINSWIVKSYKKIYELDCKKVSIEYTKNIQYKILKSINSSLNTENYIKLRNDMNRDNYSKKIYEGYQEYCYKMYNTKNINRLMTFDCFVNYYKYHENF